MDNKLSELSKPVVWVPKSQLAMVNSGDAVLVEADLCAVQRFNEDPLYSQEYVSALTQRIAELESIRADASQVFKEIGNELGCNPDNESIMMAIDALKERLATPVRLKKVDSSNVPFAGDGFNAAVDYCAAGVRAAGFSVTVEGDE